MNTNNLPIHRLPGQLSFSVVLKVSASGTTTIECSKPLKLDTHRERSKSVPKDLSKLCRHCIVIQALTIIFRVQTALYRTWCQLSIWKSCLKLRPHGIRKFNVFELDHNTKKIDGEIIPVLCSVLCSSCKKTEKLTIKSQILTDGGVTPKHYCWASQITNATKSSTGNAKHHLFRHARRGDYQKNQSWW